MIAGVLWLWVNRDPAKCFLAMMMTPSQAGSPR